MESLASGDLCQAPPSHQVFTGAEKGISPTDLPAPLLTSIDATWCPPPVQTWSQLSASLGLRKLSLAGLMRILSAGPFLAIPASLLCDPAPLGASGVYL